MVEALTVVTSVVVLLAVGMFVSFLANRSRLPEGVLLIASGWIVASLALRFGVPLGLPSMVVMALDIVAVALVVFDAVSACCVCVFERGVRGALLLVVVSAIVSLGVFSWVAREVAGLSVGGSLALSAVLLGSAPSVVWESLRRVRSRLADVLRVEAILAAPLSVVVPLVIVNVGNKMVLGGASVAFVVLLTQVGLGLGTGVFVGILALRFLRSRLPDSYASLGVLVSALVAYVLAEQVGGSGILSVATLGVFFGYVADRERHRLLVFESLVAQGVHVLVFVMVGAVAMLPLSVDFLARAAVLVLVYYALRLLSVLVVLGRRVGWRDAFLGALIAPKGLPAVAVALTLVAFDTSGSAFVMAGGSLVASYIVFFVVVSLLVSSFAVWLAGGYGKSVD